MHPKQHQRGVTLVETMVAIAILTMVSTLIWGGFAQMSRSKKRIETQLEHEHMIVLALERLSRELASAYVSVHINPGTSLQSMRSAFVGRNRGDRDRIDFTSFSHQRLYRNSHESDQNELSYFLTRHPEKNDVQVLARREQNRVNEDAQRGGRIEIIAEHIQGFELEYFDPISQQWTTSWDTTQASMQPNRLPTQVKIIIKAREPWPPYKTRDYGTRAALGFTHAINHAAYNP